MVVKGGTGQSHLNGKIQNRKTGVVCKRKAFGLSLQETRTNMPTSIKMPLRTFSPSVVRELQSKYPDAVVHIEVDAPAEPVMDEAAFWNIISLLDWGRRRNEDVLAPAVAALSRYSETAIFQFEDILAEKLFALDGEKYAVALGWNGGSKDYFSPDIFLYARCCVVANGSKFYEKVRTDPASMPKDCTFEPLLYLAEKAHRIQTGDDNYDYISPTSYETFSNAEAWPNAHSLHELLHG